MTGLTAWCDASLCAGAAPERVITDFVTKRVTCVELLKEALSATRARFNRVAENPISIVRFVAPNTGKFNCSVEMYLLACVSSKCQ